MTEGQESMHFLDYWRVICARKEVVIAVSLLVVLTGIVVTYMMPRVYMAATLVAVREETPDVAVFSRETLRFDPLFLRTQFEIIQSRPVLEEVIRRLSLDEKLGQAYDYAASPKRFETTCRLLSKSLKVQQYRDTNLIEIRIYMSEPKETVVHVVADVANDVAEVFRDQRMQVSRRATERALGALHESFLDEQKHVQEAERKVESIRQKYKIDVVSSSGGTMSLDKMTLTQLEGQRIRVRMELADKEARWNKIRSLTPEKLLDAAPYVVGDPALSGLVADKRRAEVMLSQLRESYGNMHPEIVSKEAVVKELDKKIQDALNGLKTGVEAEYDAAKAKFGVIDAELANLRATDRTAEAGGYREFNEAQEELRHAQHIRDVLETRYIQEKIELRIPRTIVEVVEKATPADESRPVSPKFLLNIILSIVLGLGCGVGLAYFIEYLDTSVKTIEDVERYMAAPVLGVIPKGVRPLVSESAEGAHAEAYRVLRTNIQFSKKLNGGKTLTCTSGSVGEGKSLTIFNLAFVCAQLGDKTLIVDSDLHRPRQHKILGLSNRIGLTNVLVGDTRLEEAIVPTNQPNLDLLPSGKLSSGSHGLLDTWKMKELVGTVKAKYDFVFFDAPPIIGVSDASLLAREMDGVLLVVQHRKYPRAVSIRAKNMLENAGSNLIGVVLNNINISRDYSYYYYHYTYSYHYTDSHSRKKAS
jgi:capsular exopolysaccharide synthesis family protein